MQYPMNKTPNDHYYVGPTPPLAPQAGYPAIMLSHTEFSPHLSIQDSPYPELFSRQVVDGQVRRH